MHFGYSLWVAVTVMQFFCVTVQPCGLHKVRTHRLCLLPRTEVEASCAIAFAMVVPDLSLPPTTRAATKTGPSLVRQPCLEHIWLLCDFNSDYERLNAIIDLVRCSLLVS